MTLGDTNPKCNTNFLRIQKYPSMNLIGTQDMFNKNLKKSHGDHS